ncbi:unnamed protein product [Schistosoma turkestanicum]|nr:unnamed protein product [Schistosoma turkestanicum]
MNILGNRIEFRSRGNMYSNEISTLNKKQSTLGPNNYTFSSTGSTHSIHMKFRTPLSNAARKPNIRSVPRLTNDFREQKTYKEDYENHRTRKMRELQPKTGPNYYENMDCYVHSPGMTSDSSDCVSLSSILDM